MTGQPVKWDMIEALATHARQSLPDLPPDSSPEDLATAYLLAYTEDGGKLSRLATQLGYSRFLLQRWIRSNPERQTQYTHARALGADALVDEGGDILDKADRDTIAVANARAGWRKWLAGKYDPTTYGDKQAPTVQVGSLHYHAALSRPLSSPTPFLPQTPPSLGPITATGEPGYPTASGESATASEGEIVIDPVGDVSRGTSSPFQGE